MKQEIIIPKFEGNTLTILEGKALELKQPEKISLEGNIKAISDFIEKRYGARGGKKLQQVDKDLAVVIVDGEKMNMTLLLDPNDIFGTVISANLERTTELLTFCINQNKQFTREELVKIIRFNRRFFEAGKHQDILNAYLKLQLTGTTELTSASDNRGNKEAAFKKIIDSQNVPTEFVLEIPIFKGFGVERFRVEVCIETTDASVRFWFESVELAELIEVRKQEIFNEELRNCQDFVIINK